MALGLVQYAAFRSRLPDETNEVTNPLEGRQLMTYAAALVAVVAVVVALVLVEVITAERLANIVIAVTRGGRDRLLRDHPGRPATCTAPSAAGSSRSSRCSLCNAVFWSLYQQQFTVVTIYADKRLDRDLFGWEMPVSWVQSINPVFIIVLAGVFAALWTTLGKRQPSTPMKFGAGTLVMGVAFFCFLPMPGGENSAPLLGLAGILLVFTVAELLISPVGLSAVDEARAEEVHDADGRALLPVHRARYGDGRHPGRLLRRGTRVAVLPLDRSRGRRHRRGRDGLLQADPQADVGGGLRADRPPSATPRG